MTTTSAAGSDTRFAAAVALQKLIPELTALALHAKQAHWNVRGAGFLPLHAFTDELAADARAWADRVAERAVALGFAVDARPATVAAAAGPFPGGWLLDREATADLDSNLDRLAAIIRGVLPELTEADVVAHDIAVDVLEGAEKYRWMLKAQGS